MSTRNRTIRITMMFDGYILFNISADNDDRWIQGVRGQINDIFRNYKTWFDLFHAEWMYAIPVYIGVIFAFGFLVYAVLVVLFPLGSPNLVIYFIIVGMVSISGYFWALFLSWLFPKFETEYMSQVRLRKWIGIVIGSIALTIVGSYVYEYLLPQWTSLDLFHNYLCLAFLSSIIIHLLSVSSSIFSPLASAGVLPSSPI